MIDEAAVIKLIFPLAILTGSIIAGIVVEFLVMRKLRKLLEKTQWDGLTIIIRALRGMPILWSALAGASATVNNIPMSPALFDFILKSLLVLGILSVTIVAARAATGFLNLYSRKSKGAMPSISIFANLAKLIVFLIGIMIILQSLGISITPMLTALGVGGLAVALALQDTLSNFFSGLLVLASGQIKAGDYVELETGVKGYVSDITWKNTTIKTIADNMIIVPNSKLSSTITTNYNQPQKEVAVRVEVGVSYDSDLRKVEKVTLEVANSVMRELPGGVPEFETHMYYHTFSDFSINFRVVMRAREYYEQYMVRHEFIKRLHERYGEEGIVIPFPIRTVYMKDKGE